MFVFLVHADARSGRQCGTRSTPPNQSRSTGGPLCMHTSFFPIDLLAAFGLFSRRVRNMGPGEVKDEHDFLASLPSSIEGRSEIKLPLFLCLPSLEWIASNPVPLSAMQGRKTIRFPLQSESIARQFLYKFLLKFYFCLAAQHL